MSLVREMFDLASSARQKALEEASVRVQRMTEALDAEIENRYSEILNLIKATAQEGKLSYSYLLKTRDIEFHLNYNIPLIDKIKSKLETEGFRVEIEDKNKNERVSPEQECPIYETSFLVSWDLHAVYGY